MPIVVGQDIGSLVESLNFKQKVDRSLALIEYAWKKYGRVYGRMWKDEMEKLNKAQ